MIGNIVREQLRLRRSPLVKDAKTIASTLLMAAFLVSGSLTSAAAAGLSDSSTADAQLPSTAMAAATQPAAAAVKVVANVPYTSAGQKACIGDLYLPAGDGSLRPAVVVVHGGAWVMGSKTDSGEADVAERLAKHGYVVFDIDYRLIKDGGTFPHSIGDIKDAIAFLDANAANYAINKERVGVFGASSGGFLALLAAYTAGTPELAEGHYSEIVKPAAVVTYSSITDCLPLEKKPIFDYMDDTPWHTPELYQKAAAATYAKTAVPTLCVHAIRDKIVPYEQSSELIKKLQASGVEAELETVQSYKHAFHEQPGWERELAFARTLAFFDKILKKP
jgi:acetyl esterase/lipase